MNGSLLLAFWGVAMALIVVPGPDWAFVVSNSSRGRSTPAAAVGLMIGYGIVSALVALGLGSLVARSEPALTVVTVAGAFFLCWLGIDALRGAGKDHKDKTATDAPVLARADRGPILSGTAVSLLNPKGLLIMIALLPQFADPSASWPMPAQLAVLGAVFTLSCGAFYTLMGRAAQAVLKRWNSAAPWIARISGAVLIALAAALLTERVIGLA